MRVFNRLFSIKHCNFGSAAVCLIAAASAIAISPAVSPNQNVQAAIDETLPDSLPAEVIADWKAQGGTEYEAAIGEIKKSYPEIADKITAAGETGYLQACHLRRVARMKPFAADIENVMFTQHHNFGGIIIGYHDNVDAGNSDSEWRGSGKLCVMHFKTYYPETETLLSASKVIRDPCISFDGKKVVFAMSGSGSKGSGYSLYEMNIDDPNSIRQLTKPMDGISTADFEPCYLPGGDIMFTSTRNFDMLDCAFNPTTNMFLLNGQGRYLYRVGFDQAHTFYPVLMDNGTVLYTRSEHNDRSAVGSMGLFVMNPDGCHQTEYFGNQLGWPLTILQAKPIPGSEKVMAIAGGFMGPYAGELMIIDRTKGYNGKQSIRMIAPERETKPDTVKSMVAAGNVKFLFQTPCPLDEKNFIVSYRTSELEKNYRLYFMDVEGNRELLAWADQSVSQPVLIKPRTIPPRIEPQADFYYNTGTFTMHDVYLGEGTKGVGRGAAKSLRVVALHYRVAGSGSNVNYFTGTGPSGVFTPAIFCPVSAYGASWAAKEVLGEAKIYEDGSAAFKAPARTPVYFQVLDTAGYCMATMRSWSTLMPGETFACLGCHENKLEPPPTPHTAQAGTPQELDKPLGVENKTFDYVAMVQPVFDRHCTKCHTKGHESGFDLTGAPVTLPNTTGSWATSYNSLLKGIGPKSNNKAINILTIFSPSQQQPPYSFGSSLSGILTTGGMCGNHHDVQVTETEKRVVACWIDLCAPYAGSYNSYTSETDSITYAKLEEKRAKWKAIEEKSFKNNNCACYVPGYIPESVDHPTMKSPRASAVQSAICFVPSLRTLVIENSSPGSMLLTDLGGRVVFRMALPGRSTDDKVTVTLPATLGAGLYMARFEGANGIRQTTISLIK